MHAHARVTRRGLVVVAVLATINLLVIPMAWSGPGSSAPLLAQIEPPTVTVTASDDTATESGPTTGQFTFTRTGSTDSALTGSYVVTGTATPGVDYAALSGGFEIPAGEGSVNVTVLPIQDSSFEGDETVILTLVDTADYDLGSPATATVTITDDDLPTVTVAASDANAAEAGPNTGTFTITRTGSTAANLTVTFTLSGTAAPTDYVSSAAGTVVIPAGSSTTTVLITPVNDSLSEPTETVILTLVDTAAYDLGSPATATVTITDDDAVTPPADSPDPKDVCKQGGWRAFGVFKNQGDCVSYIATGGKNPPALGPGPVGLLP